MLDKYMRKGCKNSSNVSIETPKPPSLNNCEIDVAHQLIMMREIPSPRKKKTAQRCTQNL